MPILELPAGRGPISCRRGEAADLAVAQPVVDERQQLAGGGDAADVATAAGADAVLIEAILESRTAPETASTEAQRNSREPCLLIRPRAT